MGGTFWVSGGGGYLGLVWVGRGISGTSVGGVGEYLGL